MKPRIDSLAKGQRIVFYASFIDYGILYPSPLNRDSYLDGTEEVKGIRNIRVSAPIPEGFSWGIGNEVNQPWDFTKFKSSIIQTAAPSVGKNFDRGVGERNFWRSIENKDMSVTLDFNSYYSGLVDVVQPVTDLMTLAAPVETNVFTWNAPPLLTVRVGDLLRFENVIIKDVSVAYSNKLDADFNPMSAQVSVTFVTTDPIGYNGVKGYGLKYSGHDSNRNR